MYLNTLVSALSAVARELSRRASTPSKHPSAKHPYSPRRQPTNSLSRMIPKIENGIARSINDPAARRRGGSCVICGFPVNPSWDDIDNQTTVQAACQHRFPPQK